MGLFKVTVKRVCTVKVHVNNTLRYILYFYSNWLVINELINELTSIAYATYILRFTPQLVNTKNVMYK